MEHFKPMIEMFIKDFNKIGEVGKKNKLKEKKIEEMQFIYFRELVKAFFKAVSIPRKKKLEAIKSIKKVIK